jgi:homoserine kinase
VDAVIVRAPATSANLGPGFDCAAVALDLWNELEVTDGEGVEIEGEGAGELPEDATNLTVRAYALLASPAGKRFRCVNRIPLESGLGSSAAAIALGLVAARPQASAQELLAAGLELEGHADNLAAALAGGACLTVDGRIVRIATDLPLAPIAVVPRARTGTAASRASLPCEVSHHDAARTAAYAALLGAGLASGDAELLTAALNGDRLHEPYRPSPLLAALRADPPAGAAATTLSGSGPTAIVWARDRAACAAELRERFPDATVLELAISPRGAL